jgi:hypothetical protein
LCDPNNGNFSWYASWDKYPIKGNDVGGAGRATCKLPEGSLTVIANKLAYRGQVMANFTKLHAEKIPIRPYFEKNMHWLSILDLVVYAFAGFFITMYLNTFRKCDKVDPADPNSPKTRCPVSSIGMAIVVALIFSGARYGIVYFQRGRTLTGLAKEIVAQEPLIKIEKKE